MSVGITLVGLIAFALLGCALLWCLVAGVGLLVRLFSGGGAVSDNEQQFATAPPKRATSQLRTIVGVVFSLGVVLAVMAVPLVFYTSVSRVEHSPVSQVNYRGAVSEVTHRSSQPADRELGSTPHGEIDVAQSEELKSILSKVSTAIDAIEESRIPLASVDLVRTLRKFESSLHGQEEINTETPAMLAEAPEGVPAWAKETPPKTSNLHIVISQPRASAEKARADALSQATQIVMDAYGSRNRGVDHWTVDLQQLDYNAIAKEQTQQFPWNFTTNVEGTAYQTYMQVRTTPEVHSAVYAQWKSQVSHGRLEMVLGMSMGLVASVALLAVFFRIERKGFWRRSLRFASLLGAGAVGLVSVVAGAEGLSQPNHIGPARNNSHHPHDQPQYQVHNQNSRNASRMSGSHSSFAGIPLNGRKIGFVVLGDRHFCQSDKIDRVANEIAKCVKGFGRVDYRIFCESDRGMKLTRSDGPLQTRTVRQTLRRCFTPQAESVVPENAARNVLRFRPDQIVLIRDATAEAARESGPDAEGVLLARLFKRAKVPVHVIELGQQSDIRVDLTGVASQSGGQHKVWTVGSN